MMRFLFSILLLILYAAGGLAQVPTISSITTALQRSSIDDVVPLANMLQSNGYVYRFEDNNGYDATFVF